MLVPSSQQRDDHHRTHHRSDGYRSAGGAARVVPWSRAATDAAPARRELAD